MKTMVVPFPLSLMVLEVFQAARVQLHKLWVSLVRRLSPRASSPAGRRLRLQLDFVPPAVAELDELRELMGCNSRAEVCQRALEWTNWVARRQADGSQFLIIRRTGQTEYIILPWKRGGGSGPLDGD